MGSIQSLLVIWGLVLFSLLVINFHKVTNQNSDSSYENEATITATSICQSILEMIQTKAFDENTVNANIQNAAQLSTTLGTDTAESSEQLFDDVDDYNNYQSVLQMTRLDSFQVTVNLYYINRSNPCAVVVSPSFCKRIDVQVDNNYLCNPVQLSSIVSY